MISCLFFKKKMLAFYGVDLDQYHPHPHEVISFYEVKNFTWGLLEQYRQQFTIKVWTPDTDPISI